MANLASVTCHCINRSYVKKTRQMYDMLVSLTQKKQETNEHVWLSDIVTELGGDPKAFDCRGEVTGFELVEQDILEIDYEGAWNEKSEFRHFLESVFEGINILYYVEEIGCEIFATNDLEGSSFPEKYVIVTEECEYSYETILEVADLVSDIIGKKVPYDWNEIEKAAEEYNEQMDEEFEERYIYLHEVQYIDD